MGGCFFPRCGNNSSKPQVDTKGNKISYHLITIKNQEHRANVVKKVNELRKKHVRDKTNFTLNENGEKIQEPSKNAKICSSHYASNAFILETWKNGETRKKLRDDAVPVYLDQKEKDRAEKNLVKMPTVRDLAPPIGTPLNPGAKVPSVILRKNKGSPMCDGKQTTAVPQQSTAEAQEVQETKNKTELIQIQDTSLEKLEKKPTWREPKVVVQPHEMPSTSGYSAPNKRTKIVKSPSNDGFNSISCYRTTAIPEQSTAAAEYQNETCFAETNSTPTETQKRAKNLLEIALEETLRNSTKSMTNTQAPAQTQFTPTENILENAPEGKDNYNDDGFKFESATHVRFPEYSEPKEQKVNDSQLQIVIPHSDGTYCVRIGNKMIKLDVQTDNEWTNDEQQGTVATETVKDLPRDSGNLITLTDVQAPVQTDSRPAEYAVDNAFEASDSDIPNINCMPAPQNPLPASLPQTLTTDSDPSIHFIVESNRGCDDHLALNENDEATSDLFDTVYAALLDKIVDWENMCVDFEGLLDPGLH